MFVGNGFIRSAAPDHHLGFLDGISYAFLRVPIEPADLKLEGSGTHKCVPYAKNDVLSSIEPACSSNLAERMNAFPTNG